MFKWFLGVWFVCVEVVDGNNENIRHAERRVINAAGPNYPYQQQVVQGVPGPAQPSPGLTAYSDFAIKQPEQQDFPGGLPKNVRTIILTKKVPVPYPVHVERKIPYPIKVPIRRPYNVYYPKPYMVEVMKQVPFPVKVPVPQPYTVEKHVPFPFKVHYDKPYPVHITKPYPVYYEKRFPLNVEKPVLVPYKVPVDRPVPVQIPFEKQVLYPVARPYPFPVKVPVDKPVPTRVEKPVPVTVEKPQLAASEHIHQTNYYASTQPTVHNFSPSPYDDVTSSLLTQGKHKVISFLPGSHNNLASYHDHSADLGTIHVSSIKSNEGNSSDWVPKAVPNPQYLTYIPSPPSKYVQYTVPEKSTKLTPVANAEPYVVQHNSVKMHYKLHYDPAKQEYSFQLMHKGPDMAETSIKQQPTQYTYRIAPDNEQSEMARPSQTYSYPQQYPKNPEYQALQQTAEAPVFAYSFQNQERNSSDPEPYGYQAVDSASSGAPAGESELSYAYQPVRSSDNTYQQSLGSDVRPLYHYVDSEGKLSSETHPGEPVSYMYIPQQAMEHTPYETHAEGMTEYRLSNPNQISTEFPRILYQQGRVANILRDEYVTTQPEVTGIPENLKTSRTLESMSFFSADNATSSTSTDIVENEITGPSSMNYQMHFRHPHHNKSGEGATSSITYEKFGVADVISSPGRTKLYPVNESSSNAGRGDQEDMKFSTHEHEELPVRYYQGGEKSTESPFNAKVNRLSSYKVPRRRAHKKRVTTEATTSTESYTRGYEEEFDKTTTLNWYEIFGSAMDTREEDSKKKKDTNSHTGAAERPPYYRYTATTTTSSSLQPPDDSFTVRPTQSLRARSRGSVKAFGRRKGQEDTGENTSTTTEDGIPSTNKPRRRRRPARRRMDRVSTEAPVEDATLRS